MTYTNRNSDKPVIGISVGDLNGIGPEVILKTLGDPRILKICVPVVYGSLKIFSKYRKLLDIEDINFHLSKSIDSINHKKLNIITCWEEDVDLQPGKVTPEGGQYAFVSLSRATEDVITLKTDAILTAPINKMNIQNENFAFPGHTEFFTEKCAVSESLMLLVSGNLRVGIVTGHIPLSQVTGTISKDKILSKVNIMYKSLKYDFGIGRPKIAILGLNPHAGEAGLLGKEEIETIAPLIEELKNKGILVFGPFPADGFFGSSNYHKFDGVLAMYHDQGLVPFKTLAFNSGVNFTAGLPIIRTSPDHGTAYDIAGTNKASEQSFREALYLAIDTVKSRRPVLA
jgi:4-hydroxythreonine-4-phosphate dehydrogenase